VGWVRHMWALWLCVLFVFEACFSCSSIDELWVPSVRSLIWQARLTAHRRFRFWQFLLFSAQFFPLKELRYRSREGWQIFSLSLTYGMRHFVFRWAITTVAVMVASSIISGIRYDSVAALIGASLLLGILNAFLRPVLLILSAPLILLTLGLFIFVVNGLMLLLVPSIVSGFHVDGFWSAFWGAIVISIVSWLLSAFFRGSDGRVHVLTHHAQIKQVQGRVIDPGDQ
jgi:putative membrane protein